MVGLCPDIWSKISSCLYVFALWKCWNAIVNIGLLLGSHLAVITSFPTEHLVPHSCRMRWVPFSRTIPILYNKHQLLCFSLWFVAPGWRSKPIRNAFVPAAAANKAGVRWRTSPMRDTLSFWAQVFGSNLPWPFFFGVLILWNYFWYYDHTRFNVFLFGCLLNFFTVMSCFQLWNT